ncbi:hypothetical protein DYB32_003768 [Aphanomyces invadans]|uniref:Sugar phosphate transporter domain-containing protein n=1 Tax=Aphanomyces invadans TaxID=157072 RepID=A0A3R7D259_9STRA|nr:hypothetical protein DYB32_003768 [Aphanomyces invadans]
MTIPPDLECASVGPVQLTSKHVGGLPVEALKAQLCTSPNPTASHEPAIQSQTHPSKPTSDVPLMLFVFSGIMASFTINGMALESLTSIHAIGENTLTLITAVLYAMVGLGLKRASREPPSTLPTKYYLFLSALTFASTMASVFALRYVSFITRILGKSCKSIPVMVLGVLLGKRYPVKKYVSVVLLCLGVAVFLAGSAHHHQGAARAPMSAAASPNALPPTQTSATAPADDPANLAIGMALLLVSLFCDGATGALEDKYVHEYAVGAFDLMFYLNGYKALWACMGVVASGELPNVISTVTVSILPLVALSLSGAFGQAFVFFSISKFGALTTAIVGTMRKVLSVALSVALFHHDLSSMQIVGLAVAFGAIGLNWVRLDLAPWTPCWSRGRLELHVVATDGDEVVQLMPASTGPEEMETNHELNGPSKCTAENIKAMQALARWDRATAPTSTSHCSTSAV